MFLRSRFSKMRMGRLQTAMIQFVYIVALWAFLSRGHLVHGQASVKVDAKQDVSAQEVPAADAAETKPGADAKPGAVPAKPAVAEGPRDLELVTKDFVVLHGRFYPGKDSGKHTIPVLLLHGWDGKANGGCSLDLENLAQRLHDAGYAALAIDFRGHGRSLRRDLDGVVTTLQRDAFRTQDFRSMILDVEAARAWLLEQNNAGRLNIEQLCIIGFEMGGIVGMHWIDYDWRIPSLPTFKQGQDVKAFVLVSPPESIQGLSLQAALDLPVVRGDLSAMLVYGARDARSAGHMKRIHNTLKRAHRPLPSDPADAELVRDLFLVEYPTTLQGIRLLENRNFLLEEQILQFLEKRLKNRQELYLWRDRTRPQ